MKKNILIGLIVMIVCSFNATAGASETYPPIPKITCSDFGEGFTPTCLSNGLIGISPGPNPLIARKNIIGRAGTVVSGFVQSSPREAFEELAAAPFPLATELKVGEISMKEHPELLEVKSQTLDMETAELITKMVFRPVEDIAIDIEVIQFASRAIPCLLCQQITLKSEKPVTVELRTYIDTDGTFELSELPEFKPSRSNRQAPALKKGFISNRGSKLGIAVLVNRPRMTEIPQEQPGQLQIALSPGEERVVNILASMVSGLYHKDPHLEALRLVRWGGMNRFDRLREKNRRIWAQLWKSRVKVKGCDSKDQRMLDAAFYYHQSNIHQASKCGYPPFGLTQNWAYWGAMFWDMDLWTLIPTILVQPEAAKVMIDYRYRGLKEARNEAALFGYRGAQYAVCVDPTTGAGTGPMNSPPGWAEQQQTPGVAIAAWEYQMATGDPIFLREKTWPLLQACAEWIESRGEFTEHGFEFKTMMGPDEWLEDVNNPTFFNLASIMAMKNAIACAKELGYQPPKNWQKIANSINLPIDNKKDVLWPFDVGSKTTAWNEKLQALEEVTLTFENHSLYSLGYLQWLFIHGLPVSDDVFRNTYLHEEKIRMKRAEEEPSPGVPGSVRCPSFSNPPYITAAAFFGEREKALEFFQNLHGYWLEPYGQLREYRSQNYGSYISAFGGLLGNVMLGLTGLRISAGDWCKYPAMLPAGWEKIEIDRIWIKGKPFKVIAEHGKKTKLIRLK